MYIKLDDGTQVSVCDIISYIRENDNKIIPIGAEHSAILDHSKPFSLDYFLRLLAKCPDTCQATENVIKQLLKYNFFRLSKTKSPTTGRYLKTLKLQNIVLQ